MTNACQDLKVIRAIQPFKRVMNGEVELVRLPEPLKPRQQAAILLYALVESDSVETCSCCRNQKGSGPFAECIRGPDKWTGGACLNCYYTGTKHKCNLRKGEYIPT